MRTHTPSAVLALATLLAMTAAQSARAADEDKSNRNFNDHIAYVASFMLPTLAPRCEAAFPGYAARTSPSFLRWLAASQDRIERGRLLTMSELKPDQPLSSYRQGLIEARSQQLDQADVAGKQRVCEGIAAFIDGKTFPGQWP